MLYVANLTLHSDRKLRLSCHQKACKNMMWGSNTNNMYQALWCQRLTVVTWTVLALCWLYRNCIVTKIMIKKTGVRNSRGFPLDYPTTSCTVMSSGGLDNKQRVDGSARDAGRGRASSEPQQMWGSHQSQGQGNEMGGACVETWWVLICHT